MGHFGSFSAEERTLIQFLVDLEVRTEQIRDDTMPCPEHLDTYGRDISITLGLQNPHLVIRRTPVGFNLILWEKRDSYSLNYLLQYPFSVGLDLQPSDELRRHVPRLVPVLRPLGRLCYGNPRIPLPSTA